MAQQATINISVNSAQAQTNTEKLTTSINGATNSSASLRLQLRQVTQELQGLSPGSARFVELSQKAGQLRDQIQDTNAVISATAGNVTENFGKALGSAVQIGVAGFQGLTAAQSLFGIENEETQKSIQKMVALLNLSQAITAFGGLSDTLTSIKAGITPILTALGVLTVTQTEAAVATGAVDAALVGEAVAAEGAAVSTGVLSVSLNTLPLVAVITGIGLLVGGLISYISSSNKAAEQDKKRKKDLENLKKAQEEESASVVQASKEYVGLIFQLKNTTAGTKERKDAIDSVNSTYGTTLQNLSDEFSFQEQLNKSIRDYISLQVIKVRQEKNIEKIAVLFEKQAKASDALRKAEQLRDNQAKESNITALQVMDNFDGIRKGVNDALSSYNEYQFQIDDLTLSSEELAIKEVKLQGTFNNGNKGLKVKTNTTKDLTKETEKYAGLLDEVKNKIEREVAVQQTSEKFRQERISGIDKEIKGIEKLYGDERQSVIDRAIQRELSSLDERFKKEGKTEQDYITAAKLIRDNYSTYLLDSEKKLLEELDTFRQEDLNNIQENYSNKENIVLESTKNIQTQTTMLQLEFEKNEAIRIINESKKTEEEKNKAILEVREKFSKYEIDLLNKNLNEQKNIIKLQLNEVLTDENKTKGEKLQAQADYDQKVIKATQDTADKINEINAGIKPLLSDEQKLNESLDKIGVYVQAISTLFSQLSTTISMINEQRFSNEERGIEGKYEFERDALENQLTEGIIQREQYDNTIKELDQQKEQELKQLRKKEFDSNKKLNMANAVISGAQAVLQALGSAPPPINIILAALVAGLSAVQFGVISSQEFTAAGGGIVPGIGSGMVDTVPARLAPGETVINAQSSAMYPELLNSINTSGGGISLKPDLPGTNKVNSDKELFSDNKSNQSIRAYVVETDVTYTQRRIKRIKQSAEF